MLTFDATSREVCAVKRQPTATPLQALVLLNDPQYVEAARALAQRAIHEGGPIARRSSRRSSSACLTGRRPAERELQTLNALYREQYDEFRCGRSDANKLLASVTLRPIGPSIPRNAPRSPFWPRR